MNAPSKCSCTNGTDARQRPEPPRCSKSTPQLASSCIN